MAVYVPKSFQNIILAAQHKGQLNLMVLDSLGGSKIFQQEKKSAKLKNAPWRAKNPG